MSAQASRELLTERHERAKIDFERSLTSMVDGFLRSVRSTKPQLADDKMFQKQVRDEFEARLKDASK